MPKEDFDNWIVSLSGRLNHQWDFAFYKNSGEIANRLRVELRSEAQELKVDSDGDIDMKTEHYGSYYIMPNAIIAGGWLTDVKGLSQPDPELVAFAQLMDSVYKVKGASFSVDSYGLRLFLRFYPEKGMDFLRNHGFDATLRSVFGDKAPSELKTLKFSTRYPRENFSDSIELEATSKDVQLRYSRDVAATDFSSFHAFLNGINFKAVMDDLRSFCEPLAATQSRRGLRPLFD